MSASGDVRELRHLEYLLRAGIVRRAPVNSWEWVTVMRIASNMKSPASRRAARAAAGATCALLLLAESAAPALADPTSQAQRIYQRIAGVQPSDATLTTMTADIAGGNALAAALLATSDPSFYNVVLKKDRK